ncbi:carboxypeptidase N subunit 2-like isoform X2 [Macrosteles quadrilineatus]|uniref:carboxypeptidase N subunit 2-like isoform X2 n=1 Tax=Macrosteles quadrilineatus TaxID=74068 RepID=UPI0023E21C09|nr:carboxypeptidase N subunit 2-like isoform X2 [Macrosteles quadrilineatus]
MWWLLLVVAVTAEEWRCPEISNVSCSCDLPHTLRCTGGREALPTVAATLRSLSPSASVSLLDCTVQNVSFLPGLLLQNVSLHGLVVSSGELRHVSPDAFTGLTTPLQALGLPNNQLDSVPTSAFRGLLHLERLDLSHNKIHRIHNISFENLTSLTFLDLSENLISWISPDAFVPLPLLHTLRLQGNRLTVAVVASLQGLRSLRELDLSGNSLAGPLGPSTLPRLPNLSVLSLAHNQLSSVTRGALAGLDALSSLSLHHNQIDVLEDHAFRAIATLGELNLAHNRIVAVSGASLAHLAGLKKLDIAHNFLRAITSDLTQPLRNLTELRLDDNDISMVATDAFSFNIRLKRFTLSENPLNCDCNLSQFASWLRNSSTLSTADKATSVCATPPSLENGLVEELSASELVCGGQEESPIPSETPLGTPMPVSGTRVALRGFQFDGSKVSLLWSVEASALTYSCDALFIYEELGLHEILLESNPLKCDSSQLVDPKTLSITLSASDLQLGHRYRYCVVLLEGGGNDESALVLGCSEIIPLLPTVKTNPVAKTKSYITSLEANLTDMGSLMVSTHIWKDKSDAHCLLTITVFVSGTLVAQRHLNCSLPWAVIHGLPQGPYQVCATLGDFPPTEPKTRCLTVSQPATAHANTTLNLVLTGLLFLLSMVLILAVYHSVRKILKRPKNHQCFLPVAQTEDQHARWPETVS